jgi:hypothetical protein
MSSKRGASRQLTSDDRSDDEGDETVGSWERAPVEALSTRKIVKVKRSSKSSSSVHVEHADKANNPFSTFAGFTSSAPGSSSSGTQKSISSGFSSFASFGTSENDSKDNSKAISFSSTTTSSSGNTYSEKMMKLNGALLTWVQKQQIDAPLALLHEGLLDYVKHVGHVHDKYNGESGSSDSIAERKNDVPAAAPISAPISATAHNDSDTKANAIAKPADKNNLLFSPVVVKQPQVAAAVSFGGESAFSASSDSAATAGFSWGAVPSTSTTQAASFSLANNSTETLPAPSFGLIPAAGGASAFPVSTNSTSVENGEEDGEPLLEPELALRNEADKDIILYETDCLLKRLDTKAEPKPEWVDIGKGALRITSDPDTGKKRILIREKVMGNITLNVSFFPTQTFIKNGKRRVQFPAMVLDPDPEAQKNTPGALSLQTYIVTTKEEEIDKAIAALEKARG